VGPGIVIPLVVLPILLVAGFVWYRRSIAAIAPSDPKPMSARRLTAEALHRLPSPPYRVVYEIPGALGDVDHVVIGPAGVIAITTVVADRPEPARLRADRGEAMLVSDAAIQRGPLDELLRPIGDRCQLAATVYWGAPNPSRPAADDLVHGSQLVEGQRVDEWIASLGGPTPGADADRVDAAWRQITMGIGRPDPLP
jgi:hypothetical protein